MEDIDLTMLARSAYRAILRSIETPVAEAPETEGGGACVCTKRMSPGAKAPEPKRTHPNYITNKEATQQ